LVGRIEIDLSFFILFVIELKHPSNIIIYFINGCFKKKKFIFRYYKLKKPFRLQEVRV